MNGMVTFKPVGRLGNFLFETASAMAYAWDNGMEFHVPAQARDAFWHPVYLAHLRNPKFDPSLESVEVSEKTFRWHQREFREEWRRKNVVLDGYWQNEKYFWAGRDVVLKRFRYPWAPARGFVSVHVRRGDYLTIKRGSMLKHPPVTPDWIRRQMAKFPGAQFQFFSDDMDWCKKEFEDDAGCNFAPGFVLTGTEQMSPEEQDMVHMSCCEHHIGSASTFSWWGSWLDRGRGRHIFPMHWITPGWSQDDFSDVIPKRWERAK